MARKLLAEKAYNCGHVSIILFSKKIVFFIMKDALGLWKTVVSSQD